MTNEEFIKSVSLDGEIWKSVVGYEDLYLISNIGRIISLPKTKKGAYGCFYKTKIKLLSCHKDKNGYLRNNNIKGKSNLVHRLVAEAFIPNPNGYSEVDHIDCNTSNCNVNNLRWCTSSMNKNNPMTNVKMSDCQKGKYNEQNGASQKIVAYNNNSIIYFPSIYEAKRQGFARTCVYRCLKDKNKKYKGYYFAYLPDYENLINKSKNS